MMGLGDVQVVLVQAIARLTGELRQPEEELDTQ